MGDGGWDVCTAIAAAELRQQSSCDFNHLFVWDTGDSQGPHLLRTEEKAK